MQIALIVPLAITVLRKQREIFENGTPIAKHECLRVGRNYLISSTILSTIGFGVA